MTDASHVHADDGPSTVTAELDVATVERELDDVARALDRLDEGTYGTCEVCGAALADDVVARSPAARHCGAHEPAR